MEPQDKEEEYQQSVWEIYRKEWATASSEKKVELNKRMRRWQELMKDGLTASQAHYRVMREELDYGVAKEPSDKSPGHSFWAKTRKAPFVILGLALVAAIVYCVVITGDRNALNTELESVKGDLASTQSELNSTKQTLASMQSELNSTKQTLVSTQSELSSTKQTLASTQSELSSTKQTLASVQNKLEAIEAELKLYKETLGVTVFSEGSSLSRQMNLIDNPIAANPTWQELKEFLLADPTDDKTYIKDIFDCSQFAEMLHNKAEAQGIKATFVAVNFRESDIGHALNAFKTTDKGLVYVDCTGGRLSIRRTSLERDKIAYVVKGKEYGSISLGKNTPLNYDSYEKMKADWNSYDAKLAAYNSEVRRFNSEIFGRVYYIGTAEWFRIEQWQRSLELQKRLLDNLRAQLEYVWEPLGIVESIKIYW